MNVEEDIVRLRDQTRLDLRRALNLSHRVVDLLADEADVGWHHGTGR